MLNRPLFLVLLVILFPFSVLDGALQAGEPEESEIEKMVLIPAGEFLMGLKHGNPLGLVMTTPQRKVNLPAYYIDKYQVTNKKYKKFVDATGHRAPFSKRHEAIYNWKNGIYTENLENHPVVLVSWYDADTYCKWAGKRLPTEAEWEKAARGTDGRLWPWGNESGKAGVDVKANTYTFRALMTMPVGSFPEGASPYGVMDMAGNVFEWTSSWFKGYPGTKYSHPLYGEKMKVMRGGAFMVPRKPAAYTVSRHLQRPDDIHRTNGFRCVKSAD